VGIGRSGTEQKAFRESLQNRHCLRLAAGDGAAWPMDDELTVPPPGRNFGASHPPREPGGERPRDGRLDRFWPEEPNRSSGP
jgi:hypothetical protein